ncbi:hypothetical protein AB0L99_27350 [Streptomyces sp. NPDC051954]|uniref:hypothetical protein n=1 Tax=Streptomyces sp. NPDC051954 TaxID=3155524 RepID=UPI00341D0979
MPANTSRAAAGPGLDPGQFHGVHWSCLGDNFTFDRLVLQGPSPNDDQNSARNKADGMFAAFQSSLGANTVLPTWYQMWDTVAVSCPPCSPLSPRPGDWHNSR